MDMPLSTVQRGGESMRDYMKRFRNFSLMYPAGMPFLMLLQTCRHNFLDKVKVRMGVIKAYTWKELVKHAEIAKKLAKKFESLTLKNRWGIKAKAMTWLNLLIHQYWKYMKKLDQRRIAPTELWNIRDNTPSR